MTGGIDGENQQYVGFNAAWTNRQAEFSTKNGMIIRSATHRDKTTNYIIRNHGNNQKCIQVTDNGNVSKSQGGPFLQR